MAHRLQCAGKRTVKGLLPIKHKCCNEQVHMPQSLKADACVPGSCVAGEGLLRYKKASPVPGAPRRAPCRRWRPANRTKRHCKPRMQLRWPAQLALSEHSQT